MLGGGTRRVPRGGCLVSVRRLLCVLRRSGEAAKHCEGGDVAAKPQGRPPGRFGKLAPHLDFPVDIVRAEPDITLKELAAALSGTEGVQVQLSSLHLSSLHRALKRALKRAGLSYKKRTDRG